MGRLEIEDIQYILYPGRHNDLSTLIILDEGDLEYVAKFGISDDHIAQIEQYATVLNQCQALLTDSSVEGTVPNLVFSDSAEGTQYNVETASSGRPCRIYNDRSHIESVLTLCRQWLSDIYSCTKTDEIDCFYTDIIVKSDVNFRSSPPMGLTHGDFVTSNILVDDSGTLNVIDWDESTLFGLPVLDYITLIVNIKQQLMSTGVGLMEYIFYQDNWYSELIEKNTKALCSDMGVSLEQVRKHIPVWITYSLISTESHVDREWHDQLLQIREQYSPEKVIW